MKNLINYLKSKPEYVWMGGELLLIYKVWDMTANFPVILSIKLFSILFSEEIFHEEIEGRPKRILWHILSFLGYIVAFSLNQTGHIGYGVGLSIFIALMGTLLHRIGSFHPSANKKAF